MNGMYPARQIGWAAYRSPLWGLVKRKGFCRRYDPATDTWTQVASLGVGCDSAGVSVLGDRLFCVGGYDGQTYLSLVSSYEPQTNEWTQVSQVGGRPL